jgi:molybdopterin-guanine dinucleotide biosynthesis protein A
MGRDKASLEVRGETLLARTVRVLSEVARPTIVVAAAEQALPSIDPRAEVLRDDAPDQGPLVAVARGLEAVGARSELAFVCGTDHPRLAAPVVRRLVELVEGHDGAVVRSGGEPSLLCAAFTTRTLPVARTLVARGERSMRSFARVLSIREVSAAELLADDAVRATDPDLLTFVDADTPEELERMEREENEA